MSGQIWPTISVVDSLGYNNPDAYETALPVNGEATLIAPIIQPSYKAGSGLVAESPVNHSGIIYPGVNDTFYGRILIEPAELDMGNLLSKQTRTITLWNGFLESRPLEAFQRLNDAGITVIEPVSIPYTLRPLEQLTYILSIGTDGPVLIDATYTWTIAGATYSAGVIGRRVIIWPYAPSWDTPVTETLSWLTNILRSYDGSEQRRGLRTKPRRSFSYAFKTFRNESARLENLLWGWQNRIYALPVWTDKSKLHIAHSRGDMVLSAKTDTYSFHAGALAALYRGPTQIEVVEIDSVGVDSISLVRGLEGDWAKGSTLMPILLGHLPTRVPLMRMTSQTIVGTLTFTMDPVTNDSYIPAQAAPTLYDGVEVLTKQPNWSQALSNSFDYEFGQLDQQTGAITWDTTEEHPRISRQYTWLLNGRTKIKNFRSMVGRRMGMRNSIYVPTWHDDFKVTRPLGSSDVGLSVLDNEFRLMVGTDPARNRVMIRLKDGSVFYREIMGVSTDGTYTVLTLNAALNRAVSVDQFKAVHLLMRSRLATDEINLVWRTDSVAQVDTTFTSILE